MTLSSNLLCKAIFTALLLLQTFLLPAQVIDSLERELKRNDITPQARIDVLNFLARDLSYVNQVRAIQYGSEALRRSQEIDYKQGLAYAYRNLANSYSYYGSFYLAVSSLHRAISLFEQLSDSVGIAHCYISMGNTYRKLNNPDKQISHHLLAYNIFNKLGDQERIGVSAHNLGEGYLSAGNLKESEQLIQFSIKVNKDLQNFPVLSSCYKVMGKIFVARNRPDSAEFYFNKVLVLSKALAENSQKLAEVESRMGLAEIYDRSGQYEKKLMMLEGAATLVNRHQLFEFLKPVYLKLIDEYSRRNNQQKVQQAIKLYTETDKLLAARQLKDRNQLIESVAMVFDLEEENNRLEAKAELQRHTITARNRLLMVTYISGFVLLLLLLLLARNNKRLKHSNETLRQQDAIIQQQNVELRALNATKDKFFSIVSHDLRAPLNSLWAFSTIILENMHELSKAQLQTFSKELRQLVERTMKMTDNLIAWARVQINDSVVHPETILLSELLPDVCQLYEDIAGAKQLKIAYEIPAALSVRADKDQLSLIIRNLISNAIKYSHAGGMLHVRAVEKDEKVNISVIDSGIGMPAATLEAVFGDVPVQSQRGTAGESGTGLGLKLCREFAAVNGGALSATSEPEKGTVFTLTLPKAIA